jgi:hypothetical protein
MAPSIPLIGFAGAFRRSKLAASGVADLTFRKEELMIDLRSRRRTRKPAAGRSAFLWARTRLPVRFEHFAAG